ncbi:MAG TPA: hypothetical protein VMF51_07090 [Nocardioides sp.]|uniref:hypothetical protein n=1 Tax=Nocardioides sp. TaxID=35761 RepID=UPI002C102182|nr:hypothetical protein [Nocardioides sp.]HTW14875.1 hypothetical protein [Nocardioides sp.]
MLRRERDLALDAFDRGCWVLRRNGEIAGHVATTLSSFWSPGRPLTAQQWVWYVVVWADGARERAQEDYPPWNAVAELRSGVFAWGDGGPRSGRYDAERLPAPDADAQWISLGLTVEDF